MTLKDWVVLGLWAVGFALLFIVGIGWRAAADVFPSKWNLSSLGESLFILGWIVRVFVSPRQ